MDADPEITRYIKEEVPKRVAKMKRAKKGEKGSDNMLALTGDLRKMSLNELAESSGIGMILEEAALPIRPEVAGVCDLLGFDPLEMANEGKLIAIVRHDESEKILAAMRAHPLGKEARIIGRTTEAPAKKVVIKTLLGAIRLVDMPTGALVPRIC